MPTVEYKSIPLNLKDVDTSKRTAVIAHSAYNNIDRGADRANKGMFTKSWKDGIDDISLYFNHDDTQAPGKVIGTHEDNEFGYTEAKMGTHTLGNDVLIMMQEGIIKNASFGFIPVIAPTISVKNQKIRDLREVKHVETSVLTKFPMNPKAGILAVKSYTPLALDGKALAPHEQTFLSNIISSGNAQIRAALDLNDTLTPDHDLYRWTSSFIRDHSQWIADAKSNLVWGRKDAGSFAEIKAHAELLERFVRNSKASDECIQQVQQDLVEIKSFIAQHDTAGTFDGTPPVSDNADEALIVRLLTLKNKVS